MIPQLKDIDSDKLKSGMVANAKSLLECISEEDRPLYDVISSINTTISSLEIYKKELIEIKNKSK
jgi:hypothetical protein